MTKGLVDEYLELSDKISAMRNRQSAIKQKLNAGKHLGTYAFLEIKEVVTRRPSIKAMSAYLTPQLINLCCTESTALTVKIVEVGRAK